MEFFKNRICVKSTPENFIKEDSGAKNNTVRVVPKNESKAFKEFLENVQDNHSAEGGIKGNAYINIQNSETGEVIEKMLTDITEFDTGKEKVWIFSFYCRTPETIKVPFIPGIEEMIEDMRNGPEIKVTVRKRGEEDEDE